MTVLATPSNDDEVPDFLVAVSSACFTGTILAMSARIGACDWGIVIDACYIRHDESKQLSEFIVEGRRPNGEPFKWKENFGHIKVAPFGDDSISLIAKSQPFMVLSAVA